MEGINEGADFDVLSYFNAPEDNWSSVCDEFDFDLDMMLGTIESGSVQQEIHSSKSSCVPTDHLSQFNSCQSNSRLFGRCDRRRHQNRNARLKVPVYKITPNFKEQLQMNSNVLVVNIKAENLSKPKTMKRKIKRRRMNLSSTPPVKSMVDDGCLEEYAHIGGSHLLPKSEEIAMSTSTMANSDVPIAIHHATLSWNSFCLMKTLCEDGTEDVIHRNGFILLPKVKISSCESGDNIIKTRLQKKQRPLATEMTPDDIKTGQDSLKTFKKEHDNLENVPANSLDSRCKKVCTGCKSIANRTSVPTDEMKTENGSRKSFENSLDLSKFPKFKVKYLQSMKERLERINSLPEAKEESDMQPNNCTTNEERQVFKEFFSNPQLTSRYTQIRNHILRMWRQQRPKYLGKTLARRGLEKPCDVNTVGSIHLYLERIGAINYSCLRISLQHQGTK